MKYLLLGGAGFIGTHLAKRLLSQGHQVIIIDSLATSQAPDYPVVFVQADIRDIDVEPYIKSSDVIYFLAGSLGVAYIDKNPKLSFDNNIGLMNKLIPLFEKHQKKVIFSSTSEVYGEGPFAENNNLTIGPPTKLRWGYAAAKLITEFSITSSSFPWVIVRFFNVTGPGQLGDYGMVLPRFIKAALNDEDLYVHGDGNQVRSFCHVSDAVDALLEMEKFNNEIFNLGSDEPVTITELAHRVIDIVGTDVRIRYIPYHQVFSNHHGDIMHRCPDLTKVRSMLEFRPKRTLDDIIRDCL